MMLNMNVFTNRFELSINSSIREIHQHFVKANNDKTLNTMFAGLQKKTIGIDGSYREKTILFNNIYIAYGRRQEDFDRKEEACKYKLSIKMDNKSNLSPECLLSKALQKLDNY